LKLLHCFEVLRCIFFKPTCGVAVKRVRHEIDDYVSASYTVFLVKRIKLEPGYLKAQYSDMKKL
jgi:hypothetical protein